MYTQIVDYLADRAATVLNPKVQVRGVRAAVFTPQATPVLEVYQAQPATVTRLTTDGCAEITDTLRVGFYVGDPERLTQGVTDEEKVRSASTAIDYLVPKLLGIFSPGADLPGVELTLTGISRRIKSGSHYGIELSVKATYIVAPEAS